MVAWMLATQESEDLKQESPASPVAISGQRRHLNMSYSLFCSHPPPVAPTPESTQASSLLSPDVGRFQLPVTWHFLKGPHGTSGICQAGKWLALQGYFYVVGSEEHVSCE